MPLFEWLTETPVAVSWWLWAAIGVLGLLVVNTGLCSIESIRGRYRNTRLLILIAPQIMHAGFLLIVLAHLLSASGGMKQIMPVHEGEVIAFADGTGDTGDEHNRCHRSDGISCRLQCGTPLTGRQPAVGAGDQAQ